MAIIGFIAILALSVWLIIIGFGAGWLFLASRDRMCAFLALAASATGFGGISEAIENAPFTITMNDQEAR